MEALGEIVDSLDPIDFVTTWAQNQQRIMIDEFKGDVSSIFAEGNGNISDSKLMEIHFEAKNIKNWQAKQQQRLSVMAKEIDIHDKAQALDTPQPIFDEEYYNNKLMSHLAPVDGEGMRYIPNSLLRVNPWDMTSWVAAQLDNRPSAIGSVNDIQNVGDEVVGVRKTFYATPEYKWNYIKGALTTGPYNKNLMAGLKNELNNQPELHEAYKTRAAELQLGGSQLDEYMLYAKDKYAPMLWKEKVDATTKPMSPDLMEKLDAYNESKKDGGIYLKHGNRTAIKRGVLDMNGNQTTKTITVSNAMFPTKIPKGLTHKIEADDIVLAVPQNDVTNKKGIFGKAIDLPIEQYVGKELDVISYEIMNSQVYLGKDGNVEDENGNDVMIHKAIRKKNRIPFTVKGGTFWTEEDNEQFLNSADNAEWGTRWVEKNVYELPQVLFTLETATRDNMEVSTFLNEDIADKLDWNWEALIQEYGLDRTIEFMVPGREAIANVPLYDVPGFLKEFPNAMRN